jgi:hypothetical protein
MTMIAILGVIAIVALIDILGAQLVPANVPIVILEKIQRK